MIYYIYLSIYLLTLLFYFSFMPVTYIYISSHTSIIILFYACTLYISIASYFYYNSLYLKFDGAVNVLKTIHLCSRLM